MLDLDWIHTTGTTLVMVLLSALGIYAALLLLTRLTGLRSFAKMSSFDFAITVAFGTILASTILSEDPPLLTSGFALLTLFGIQYAVSTFRRLSSWVEHVVDNEPLVVMAHGEVLSEHLDRSRMTEGDLKSKLRMAGVRHPSEVLAVVFETTGDVSVVKKGDEVDPWIFDGVRGASRLSFDRPAGRDREEPPPE